MTASEGGVPHPARKLIYLGTLAVIVALVIWGVLAFKNNASSTAASSKAEQLRSRLQNAGLPAPETRVIADTLGINGGLVCQDPSNPLIKARYQDAITNGASGPGTRPVIGDQDVTEAVGLAIATYCPDHLGAWIKQVRGNFSFADISN